MERAGGRSVARCGRVWSAAAGLMPRPLAQPERSWWCLRQGQQRGRRLRRRPAAQARRLGGGRLPGGQGLRGPGRRAGQPQASAGGRASRSGAWARPPGRLSSKRPAEKPIVVDAIFGTGFEGEPRGLAAEAIEAMNRMRRRAGRRRHPVGRRCHDGWRICAVQGRPARSRWGCPSAATSCFPGKALTGELVVADIGIPARGGGASAGLTVNLAEADDVKAALPVRPPDAHKWTCGHVACICGSTGLTGAAALTSDVGAEGGCRAWSPLPCREASMR